MLFHFIPNKKKKLDKNKIYFTGKSDRFLVIFNKTKKERIESFHYNLI